MERTIERAWCEIRGYLLPRTFTVDRCTLILPWKKFRLEVKKAEAKFIQ
ncbi:MAG: hypothetical protein LH702_17970 [Phormidesmis sp. CAN_BIN44]|nr:hypothetical protein [Phormidesmis sp. CAN_BIN44]